MKYVSLLTMIVALALALSGCGPTSSTSTVTPTTEPRWGIQTRTSGCLTHADLPDSACTPGDIFTQATKADVCTPGYARSVRNVPQSVKNKAYAEYGVTHHLPGEYEVDHLVSLELGGSNTLANLWPEAAKPQPGFHEKDQVENYLHDQVCSGAMSLKDAQIKIATDWLAVYHSMPGK